MKKTLIAFALATLPVAAMADVTLYGQIKGGVEVGFKEKSIPENGTVSQKVKGTETKLVDHGSRIGFKGHEHLSGDVNAIWQLEQSVNIGGTSTGFGTRQSFIGLQSNSLGTVKAGHLDSPVKTAAGRLDEWEYDNGVLGLGHYTRGTDASKRTLAVSYTTPNVAGFSATAFVAPSDNAKVGRNETAKEMKRNVTDPNGIVNRDAAIYGLGATYENNGFFADAAGGFVKGGANNGTLNMNPALKEQKGYQAVANVGYENDQFLAGIGYNRTKHVDEDYDVANEVAATVAYKVNPGLRLKGTAAHGFKLSDQSGARAYGNGKYFQGIVGADYAFSKRTSVSGSVGYIEKGKKETREYSGVAGVGLKHKF